MKNIPWNEIESGLESIASVEGGNSDAKRGIVTLSNDEKIFVKIGGDDRTKEWANKEIRSYAFLKDHSYKYIPQFLSTNEDQSGFAIEALLSENGWDWKDNWSDERLQATLVATDALADIKPDSKYAELLKPVISDDDNGWPKLFASKELQASIREKLSEFDKDLILGGINSHVEKASHFKVRHDTLVHDDVRADNCAWNAQLKEVKLVDWNWLELGDRRLDLAAFLVHIHKDGFDVLKDHRNRLDADALHWMAGFWFEAASKPIWPGGPEKLRNIQLRAGITALKLSKEIEENK
ncbi:MAG: hypothetical protein JWP09_349 [Candidatus Taylorbacteria bacterium]|nr:hypothetical protein [Candidatus Taylorbacteria bacterium]